MAELELKFAPAFRRDYKKRVRTKRDRDAIREVFSLIRENTEESRFELTQRHRAHMLSGSWKGSHECHICNAGDWLLVWRVQDGIAVLQRTGTHDDIFR